MPLYDFSQDLYFSSPIQLPSSHLDEEEDMMEAGINDHRDWQDPSPSPTSHFRVPTYVYPIAQIKNRHINPNHTVIPSPSSSRGEKAYRCPVIIVYYITVFLTYLFNVPTDAKMYESKFFYIPFL